MLRTVSGRLQNGFYRKSFVRFCLNVYCQRSITSNYATVYKNSIEESKEFFAEMSQNITWFKPWLNVLDDSKSHRWFIGGKMNTCYNALDRHVLLGRGNQTAVVHDSPLTESCTKTSYSELLDQVSRFAGVLQSFGVAKGDRVVIYMPAILQAVISMLACARLGAIHTVVFGGFSAKELSVRIDHAKPKVVITANCGIEPGKVVEYMPIVRQAISMSGYQARIVTIVFNRPELEAVELKRREFCFSEQLNHAFPVDCVSVDANDPLYLLYTSGTTGQPKGVIRTNGGHAVVLTWSMKNLYGVNPGEVWWAASDLGWVVGHSYICYGPLLHGNTSVLYEGKPVGTPDAGAFFRVLHDHSVASMFVAPTALRSIRRTDPEAELGRAYPIPNFRYLFVAGEHCDVETLHWSRRVFQKPVLDHWWQTETGWPITSSCVGLGNNLHPPDGSAGVAVPGWNVKVLRTDGTEATAGELGDIVVKAPLPPGFTDSLWHNKEKFEEYFSKYPGYYSTADSGYRDKDGYFFVMARTDDIINVAGHRLSTSHLEEAVMGVPEVAECAVVGIKDELKGQVPLGFCILRQDVDEPDHMIQQKIINHVREYVGPVASFKLVIFVAALPKTRSGKIARNTLSALADGKPFKIPATIEDESVYASIKVALQDIGLARQRSE